LCFCTEEELQKERERAQAEHRQPIYSGKCRAIPSAEAEQRRTAGESCAIRLRIPDHPIRFHDIVHGDVEFSNEVVSDPIILRSNGMPVYNYVVVIDDALMKMTHVIRGDDHLSNTPKQVALYEALGWPVPEFAHLSTILGGDRERLSKRHGATSIANFRDMGVLPEALVNYLALLGWAPSGGTGTLQPGRIEEGIFAGTCNARGSHVRHGEALLVDRHYIKTWPVGNLTALSAWFLSLAGYIELKDAKWLSAESFPHVHLEEELLLFLTRVTELLAPSVDRLDQLPERASLIFNYDAKAALAAPAMPRCSPGPTPKRCSPVSRSRLSKMNRRNPGTSLPNASNYL